ncbi:MAG: class I SAM-dependent methyltransferase [Candidatus Omnitrophica bacterium]|nr:class I SAM-dependent methyltransferase [Candidatus Omnitrophota bacterium]
MNIQQNKNLYTIWNAYWKGMDKTERLTVIGRLMFKAKVKALIALIPSIKTQSMIEVGCGLGYTLKVFHEAGIDSCGIDISSDAVTVCRNKGLQATVQKLEEVQDLYDLVSSDGMLEHFLNFEPYAQHMMRIARRYVLLIQPNHGSFVGKTLVYGAEILRRNHIVYEYNYRISDFIDVFNTQGFEIKQNIPVFFDVFRILLFEKK